MLLKYVVSLVLSLALWAPTLAAAETSQASPAGTSKDANSAKVDRSPRVPTFSLNGDLAGDLQVFTTAYEDTFAGIGNELALGYLELVKANPGIDPWLPGEGTHITLPRMYVLPDSNREGIVINLAEYRLYYFTDSGVQVYPVGVGTEDNPSPLTNAKVTMPLESPAWYPPASIRAEYEASGDYLPRMIPPGPDNPLGSHALMLSEKGYLIHGTNKQFGVGMAVSHGCFRMYNEDISRFAYQVSKGTPVQVIREPVKVGASGGEIWLEVHRPREDYTAEDREELWRETMVKVEAFQKQHPNTQVKRMAIEVAVDQADGIPRMIGEKLTQVAADESTDKAKPEKTATSGQTLYF
ncbi:L,D-transpeptidase family protein [Marinobacter sp. AL4B]|uniref:L,D-transpeptidase family protein n=1 Tax=Marinobacter sp. AL4B TaxID=2871173 RepID=UPI001CAA6765|nr:L,D-transpeptidase family protein [Marinobacter sp. AL4B]MBZ0335457.1 L,D-transpeptidase family protein [Marinobacter sp. AL4B]